MKVTVELPAASRGEIRAAGEILRKLSREFGSAPTVKAALKRGIDALIAWHRALPADGATPAAAVQTPAGGVRPPPYDPGASVRAVDGDADLVVCRFCGSACERTETPSLTAWRCTAPGCVGHGQWVARHVIEARGGDHGLTAAATETAGMAEG